VSFVTIIHSGRKGHEVHKVPHRAQRI